MPHTSALYKVFFSIWILFHEHSRITGLQGKGEGIPLTPHYHFHPLHRHLEICRAITAGSSPLHIASSWTRTGNLSSYAPLITMSLYERVPVKILGDSLNSFWVNQVMYTSPFVTFLNIELIALQVCEPFYHQPEVTMRLAVPGIMKM